MWRREYARYTGKIIQERVPFEESDSQYAARNDCSAAVNEEEIKSRG